MTPCEAYYKACNSGNRSPELEAFIITDKHYAYRYAANVIKGRWIESEDIIVNSPEYSYYYAINVIKGKLPDNMHNMMILYAIEEPNSYTIKKYFEYIK